jgi:hypothetical protein
MTPEELETLKLKGMLATASKLTMRHTPYAANEDEAKDYPASEAGDRLEREKEITDSEEREHMKRMLEHANRILAERQGNPKNE